MIQVDVVGGELVKGGPGVFLETVGVLGGGARVEGVGGGVNLQSLGQSSVPLIRSALQVTLQSVIIVITEI